MGVLALNQFSKTTMAGTKQYLIIWTFSYGKQSIRSQSVSTEGPFLKPLKFLQPDLHNCSEACSKIAGKKAFYFQTSAMRVIEVLIEVFCPGIDAVAEIKKDVIQSLVEPFEVMN